MTEWQIPDTPAKSENGFGRTRTACWRETRLSRGESFQPLAVPGLVVERKGLCGAVLKGFKVPVGLAQGR